jgi:uncharacterized RDD family membrane protein YckC
VPPVSQDALVSLAAPGPARWRAAGWDYLGIAGWLALLAAGATGVRAASGTGTASVSPAATDGIAFGASVLPVWACLTAAEARSGAGWGKRRAGLRVVGPDGGPPGRGRAATRNAVKLLPWQLAHVAVARLALEVHQPATIAVSYGLAVLLPGVSLAVAWRDPAHRALHDRVAGTRVIRQAPR